MGVLRQGGGISGAEDYLVHGVKQHNELSRDELDQRVILSGDLDITRAVIAGMENTGMKYLHFTFSVKEKDLPVEKFREIDAEIRNMLLAAYPEGTLDYYSELQRPKQKTILDKATGELIDRLDHIHILIPRVNLVTGKIEDPSGFGDRQNVFFDALQEYINIKFDLASPKDNPRNGVSHADIVARFKDDDNFKKGQFKNIKSVLREAIVAENIADYDGFKTYLKTLGEVKVTNKGKDNEYLGIKLPGMKKFVNLYEEAFRKSFFDLPQAEMQQRLGDFVESGKSRMIPKKTLAEYEKLLNDWHTFKAREVRFLNSGNKERYAKYHESSLEDKLKILSEIEKKSQERFEKKEKRNEEARRKQQGKSGPELDVDRPDAGNRSVRDAGSRAVHKPVNREIGSEPPPAARGRVRSLSELAMVPTRQRTEGVLSRDVSGDLEQLGAEGIHSGLRRTDPHVNEATGRTSDSVVSQLLRDVQEAEKIRSAQQQPDIKTIKLQLDARRLLSDLAATHGLKPGDYVISPGADGGSRIRHKDEKVNHNLSDFLTKHMHLTWAEAQPYLQQSYDRQLRNAPERKSKPARDERLWKEFIAENKKAYENRIEIKAKAWEKQIQSEKLRRREINDKFLKGKARLAADPNLDKAARKGLESVLAKKKADEQKELDQKKKIERAEVSRKKTLDERYQEFLIGRAQAGDRFALVELRRQQDEREEDEQARKLAKGFMAVTAQKVEESEVVKQPALQHSINKYGDVTYSKDGREILHDRGNRVEILDESRDTIEDGLRLSAQKWGGKMKLYGSQSFIEEAIRISVEKNLGITFKDEAQEQYRQEYAEQLKQQKYLQQKGQQFVKTSQAEKAAAEAAAERAAVAQRQEEARAAAERAAAEQRKAEAAARVPAMPQPAPAAELGKATEPVTAAQPKGQSASQPKQTEPKTEDQGEEKEKSKIVIPRPGGRGKKRDDSEQDR